MYFLYLYCVTLNENVELKESTAQQHSYLKTNKITLIGTSTAI